MSEATATVLRAAAPRPLWLDRLGEQPARPALDLDAQREADVVIVGAGFSGIWTAYHLTELDPTLHIVVLDRHHVGFGASGRNGGWAVGELAASHQAFAARSSAAEALRLERAVMRAVDDIGTIADEHGISCGFAKGGNIRVATTAPQAARQAAELDHARSIGHGPDVIRLLDADEARAHLAARNVHGGIWFDPVAALDPAQLIVRPGEGDRVTRA